MALLSGARALASLDNPAARQAFAEGVQLVEHLPLRTHSLGHVLNDAVRYGALVDPVAAIALFRRLQSDYPRHPGHIAGTMLVQSLAQGGEINAALELLEDPACDTRGAGIILHLTPDPALQRRAMVAARDRWRRLRQDPESVGGFQRHEFPQLFSQHRQVLDAKEQAAWLDELLQAIEYDPDQETNSGFGENVRFHSTRDTHLFQILGVLRALKPPEEVDAILRRYPEVAAAAQIYPLGLESLMSLRPPAGTAGGGRIGSGSGSGFGSRDRRLPGPSTVPELLEEARRLHREDIDPGDPNLAPHVFWPSCHAYKLALYWAGRHSGMDAEPLLDQVPDIDFAILAAIEFAAGVLGLPEPFGVRMEHHPKRHG
uniref:Uncharacterized protein n=1 Tax=Solibacter usitatus (strain Ellin6076) TaxID=234267 RepID=Q01U16_SOLUE